MHRGCFLWTPTLPLAVPRVCARACSSWPGRAGRPPGRVLVPLTHPVAVLSFFVRPPPGWGCPWLGCLVSFPPPPPLRANCFRLSVLPGPGCPGPWRSPFVAPPQPLRPRRLYFPFPFSALLCPGFSVVSGPRCPRPLRFVAAPPPFALSPLFVLSFFCFFFLFPRTLCLGLSVVSGPGCPRPLPFVAAPRPPLLSPRCFFFGLFSPLWLSSPLLLWVPCRAVLFCAISCRARSVPPPPPPPPSCCPLGAAAWFLVVVCCSCSVLGCGAVLICCAVCRVVAAVEAVPRTPWPGYGIQPVSGPLTPCTACSVP